MSAAPPGRGLDQFNSLAEVLAMTFSTAAVRRILSEHTADETGHCRGCRYPTSATPVWPCRLWEIANEAERIRQTRGPA
jgi:hypothetical protein